MFSKSGHHEWPSIPSPIGRPGDAAVEDLHRVEELAVLVPARVEHVRRGAVAGGRVQLRGLLAERAAEHVEQPGERVRAAAERRREARLQQAALRHHDVQQRVEAVVEEDLGIVDHDQVDPDEHLEHALGEVEVDRPERLRVGARPVEEGVVALAPDRQLHLERAVAEPVVVDVVLEALRLLRDRQLDQRAHRLVRAVEQRLERGEVRLLAEPLAQVEHAPLARAAAGDDREQVGAVHLGQPDVVEDQPEDVLLHLPALDRS